MILAAGAAAAVLMDRHNLNKVAKAAAAAQVKKVDRAIPTLVQRKVCRKSLQPLHHFHRQK